ncbi:MAG TPA: amidohydrolase [Gemmatimonadales bacterium]|nr:amidohydrolase [Gemmatimonadales bacterium]
MTEPPSGASAGFLRARNILTLAQGCAGDAIWWQEGRIREVGSAVALDRRVPREVPRYDLPDALVTPGFVDGHTHFAMWALGRSRVQLVGAATREAAVARVAAAHPVQGWVLGQGWDANGWDRRPDRRDLDAVQTGPVFLDSLDVHAGWVNSAALVAAGIDRATPDPAGGRIVRDANGDPTGLLLERAVELVGRVLPQPPAERLDAALTEAQTEAHRLGITGIHDVEGDSVLEAFRRLESTGGLRLRVLFQPPVASLPDLVDRGVRSGQGTEWLTFGGVKLFLDGSLGSRTAWMLEPYQRSRDRGMPITGEREAGEAVRYAARHGLSATVHAIGDAAVRRALDLITPLPHAAVPHRIEHFQCVHRDDLDRAAAAGIVVSMQPAHLLTDIPLVDRHWGGRGRGAYAFRSLRNRGTPLVFGSDVPVASPDPREGLFAALERRVDGAPRGAWRPDEVLGFEEAVYAYTRAAARAGGIGGRRGTLAPGMDADLVAWSWGPDAERGDGAAVRAGSACLTVVGGEVVMRR